MKITIYSKAGYTSWAWIGSLKLLVDAGENVHNTIESRVLNIRDVLLTHAHTDHFAGLHAIVGRRSAPLIDPNQEHHALRIFYPQNSETFRLFFEFLRAHLGDAFETHISLHPLTPDSPPVPLHARGDIRVQAVLAHHRPDEMCLSYRIEQARTRLRPEYAALSKSALREAIATHGRAACSHDVHVPLLWFSGDTEVTLDPHAQNAQCIVHESTFIDPHRGRGHSTLLDALGLFRTLTPRWMVLNHISTRYTHDELQEALETHTTPEERARIHLILPGALQTLNIPISGL